MSEPDTSAEAVETLAAMFAPRGPMVGASDNDVIYGMIADTLRALLAERDGLDALIDRMHAQDVAAIQQWQAAHSGNDLLWPNHMRLTAWCMGEVAKAHAARDEARAMLAEALPQATHDSGWGDHDASTVTGPRPLSLQALEQRVAAIEERMRNR